MKLILDAEAPCPVSGMLIRGVRVPYHTLPLQVLNNLTIMIYCPNHKVRSFIGDRTTCAAIIEERKVLHRVERHIPNKELKKEAGHGTTP